VWLLIPTSSKGQKKLPNEPSEKVKRELLQLEIEQSRIDPNTFIEFVFRDKNNNRFEQQWFHEEWQNAMLQYQMLMILASQEHGKTEQLLGHLLWHLGRHPNERIKIIGNSDEEAKKRVSAVAEHIERNPRLRLVFPHLKASQRNAWTFFKIFVERNFISKDPSLEAKGILSSGAGGRADVLVYDDPVDLRNTFQNPSLIPKVIEQHDNVWDNLCDPDAKRIYICTPWVKNDLTHTLIDRGKYKLLRYFAGHEKDGSVSENRYKPIWPSKWGHHQLKEKEQGIGTRAYDRAFRGIPLSREESLFNKIDLCINWLEGFEKVDSRWPRYTGVDLAISKKDKSCYRVIFTIAKGLDNQGKLKRYPLEIKRGRWGSKDTAKEVYATWEKYNPQIIMVENNAYQQAFLEWCQEYAGREKAQILPLKAFTTGKNKFDPNVGLPSLAAEIDNQSWEILMGKRHDLTCQCNLCTWIKEMKEYPIGMYDDTVMACWFAREASKEGISPQIRTL
jgi:hypothetical protein